jgi:hypothetical protein
MKLNFQGEAALQVLVGQSCGSAPFSRSARAAWLAESGCGHLKARTSLRSFWRKFGRRGSAALPSWRVARPRIHPAFLIFDFTFFIFRASHRRR